ncbi:MAG: HTTM domain-containing protein [Rhodothermales bacterium]
MLLGIDLRALAVFRVAIGVILLVDLVVRATALGAHYTDAGVVPRSFYFTYYPADWALSLHLLSGSLWWQAVLFAAAGLAALALTAGYRTRAATWCAWLLTLSLHTRNPLVLNGGDWLLLDLLLWSLFLPLGARFSLDALAGRPAQPAPYHLSVATLGILLQVCFVYWFTVIFKAEEVWLVDGSALQYALRLDRFVRPAGVWLLGAPDAVLNALSVGTYWLEMVGPALAFVPFITGFWRSLAALSFIAFHAGLAATLMIGLFPFVCMAAWVLFLPAPFWDRLGALVPMDPARRFAVHNLPRFRRLAQRLRVRGIDPGAAPGLRGMVLQALLLVYMLSANLLTANLMESVYYDLFFSRLEPFGNAIRFEERWNMFAPAPPTRDGWYVMEGRLADGASVDLFHGGPLSWERPAHIAETYKNQRWRKYLEYVMDQAPLLAPELARYWLRQSRALDPALTDVRVVLLREETRDDFSSTPVELRVLATEQAGEAPNRANTLIK